jgi:hypothetical protein
MHIATLHYDAAAGWSAPFPSDLDGPSTLLLAFAAPRFGADAAPLAALAAAFPRSVLLGCSTAGEIAGTQVCDANISVAVARFDHTLLRAAYTPIPSAADSAAAGERLAAELVGPELGAVFVLSEGLNVNGSQLVDGLARRLPAGVPVTGGLAGDGARFEHSWVLRGGRAESGQACAVGFYGERLHVGHGCAGGWQDFGPERRITRAEGNVLYELDGRPALELYKTYLGERAQGLPGAALLFPLSVRREGDGQPAVVRTILGLDETQQSLTFAGDLPAGGLARLMRASADQLIDSAGDAARQATAGLPAVDSVLLLSVSCVGRRLVLGERTDEEVEAVAETAPAGSAHLGLYSYGEIAPSAAGGGVALHNQTMTVTVLAEA